MLLDFMINYPQNGKNAGIESFNVWFLFFLDEWKTKMIIEDILEIKT